MHSRIGNKNALLKKSKSMEEIIIKDKNSKNIKLADKKALKKEGIGCVLYLINRMFSRSNRYFNLVNIDFDLF